MLDMSCRVNPIPLNLYRWSLFNFPKSYNKKADVTNCDAHNIVKAQFQYLLLHRICSTIFSTIRSTIFSKSLLI